MKKSLLARAGALLLSLSLLLPQTAAANAGTSKLVSARQLSDNLTYINTISDHETLGREESFALELVPGGSVYPITVQGDTTLYGTGTISWAITQARQQGYNVLAGINSDFYSILTGVPLGISIENGIYRSSPEDEPALVFTGGRAGLVENPSVTITLDNRSSGASTQVTKYNKWRVNGNGLYLFSSDFSTVSSRTSGPGWAVKLRILEGQMTVSCTMRLEVAEAVRLDGACPLEEGYLVLTADDSSGLESVFQSFSPGDAVTLTTRCDSEELKAAQWATGCGDILVRDGQITDTESWVMPAIGSAPRTAVGVRADGTVLYYLVDGRRRGHSLGLSLTDLAQELIDQGCVWAVNLDGGGSSAMSVRSPGDSLCSIVNNPSDGRARSCASYILLVTDDPGDGIPAGLALKTDGSAVLAGSTLPLGEALAYDSGLNPVELDLSDLTVQSLSGLGTVEDLVYTAGAFTGTDTLLLYSPSNNLSGTAQVHVVEELTELTVSVDGEAAGEQLNLYVDSQVQLGAAGTYWSRQALWGDLGPVYSLEGDIGEITPSGLFTAGLAAGTGTISVTAGGMVQTIPVTLRHSYTDVSPEDWSYEAIRYCYDAGIASGVSSTRFGKEATILRGDFMLMLYRAVGSPAVTMDCTFTDVSPDDYYATAIAWAQETQIAAGIGGGQFGARQTITRQDAFTIVSKALPLLGVTCEPGIDTTLDRYVDKGLTASYAVVPTATLVEQYIITGGSEYLNPTGDMTREQMASVLYQCHNRPVISDTPEPAAE